MGTGFGMGFALRNLGSAVLPGSPTSFLCTPAASGVGRGAGKALVLCKLCPAEKKMSLCHQHICVSSTDPKYSPKLATVEK